MPHHIINIQEEDYGVDKFDGSFEQEESGCTILINETINLVSTRGMAATGLYSYLLCRPKNWRLNVKHLAKVFECNKDKIYQNLDALIEIGVLSRTQSREKGKFTNYHYRTHVRPRNMHIVQLTPRLEKPETVKPDTVFPDTYKTKNIKTKENIKTTTTEKPSKNSGGGFFSNNHTQKILALKMPSDTRTDEVFLQHAKLHVESHKDPSKSLYQRVAMLCSLLKKLNESGEVFIAKGFASKPKVDYSAESVQECRNRTYVEEQQRMEQEDSSFVSDFLKKNPHLREKYPWPRPGEE